MGEEMMTKRSVFAVVLLAATWIVVPAVGAGVVAPTKPSQIVSATANQFKFDSPSCPNGGEVINLGNEFVPPPKQVFMITGFHWGAGGNAGDLFEAELTAWDDSGTNRVFVAALEGRAGGDGLFAGTQIFPTPLRALHGQFKHLCVDPVLGRGGIQGTSTPWVYGFFAPDK
jgi:hypothetical protein